MKRFKKIMARSLLILVLICLVYFLAVRKFLMTWGATDQEQQRFYTGDSIVKKPATVITIATSVHAAPSSLWPWIAQMGQQKGGFYTYTWLENIFGCKLKNADRVHPEWQDTKEGDLEPVCYSAVKRNMPGWIVATIIPGKALVYRSQFDSSWTMGYYIDSSGENLARLITRMRYTRPGKFGDYILDKAWMEWAHCIMQRGSINGIKKRAEKMAGYSDLEPGTPHKIY